MKDEILVSILCITYNHESYIADAIESFLMQKTNFEYEILIHDDASTDKTAEIIKDYESKYPNVIKPIYQKENQYSTGVKVGNFNIQRAIGKYYALCEGDDYWTDSNKLQKQVDFLEKNPDYCLCVHAATIVDSRSNKKINYVRPSRKSKDFTTEEIIFGGGGLFATSSMVYRRDEFESRPVFFNSAPSGDYPLAIFLSLIGKVYYMDDIMSTYRFAVPGSWTERVYLNEEKRIKHVRMRENMLREVDEYTKKSFNPIIEKKILKDKFEMLLDQGKIDEAKIGKFHEFYNELTNRKKLKMHLKKYLPKTFKFLKEVKKVFY